jgi:hypothetical protein
VKAFWQVIDTDSANSSSTEIVGFIPLHRTDIFHNLKSYPIISFEGEQTRVVLGSNLDRNHLFPLYPEVDALYMTTLKKLYALFKSQKWCCVVLPEESSQQHKKDKPVINSMFSCICMIFHVNDGQCRQV